VASVIGAQTNFHALGSTIQATMAATEATATPACCSCQASVTLT
jgi:hypothetical protein